MKISSREPQTYRLSTYDRNGSSEMDTQVCCYTVNKMKPAAYSVFINVSAAKIPDIAAGPTPKPGYVVCPAWYKPGT